MAFARSLLCACALLFCQPPPGTIWEFQEIVLLLNGLDLLLYKYRAILDLFLVFCIPEQCIRSQWKQFSAETTCFSNRDLSAEVLTPKHFIQNASYKVDVLIPNLHKNAAGLGQ